MRVHFLLCFALVAATLPATAASVTCTSRAGNAFVLPEGSVCPDVPTTTCGANQYLCEVRDTTGNDIVESYCEIQGRPCRPYCQWPANTACLETQRDTLGNFMNQHYVCKNIQTDCPCGHTKCNVNGKEVCLAGSTCPTPVCSDTDLSCPATWPSTQGYCRPATSVCGCGVECAVAGTGTLKQCYPGTACPDTSACPGANEMRCPIAGGGTACMVASGGTCPAVAVPVVCPDSLKCSRPVVNSAATGTTTTTMTEEYCLPVGSTETVCPVTCSADQQSCPSLAASGVECRPASDTCPEVCPSGQQICSRPDGANNYCSATCCPTATPYHCGTDTAGSPICSATATCPVLCPSDMQTCLNSHGDETCMPSGTACPTFCPDGYTQCGRETTDAASGATVVSQQCVKAEKEDGSTWPCPAVCPLDLPVLCDGDAVTAPSCAANAASCPSVVQCGGGFKLCQRALVPAAGTTATGTTTAQTTEKFCVEDGRQCPATCGTGLVSCSDGSCAPSTTLCPITCGVGQILCDTEVMRATIAGITQSNPAVITLATAVAGIAAGDVLLFEGLTTMANVNGMSCTVTAITSTSVTCGGLDTTAFPAYADNTGFLVKRSRHCSSSSTCPFTAPICLSNQQMCESLAGAPFCHPATETCPPVCTAANSIVCLRYADDTSSRYCYTAPATAAAATGTATTGATAAATCPLACGRSQVKCMRDDGSSALYCHDGSSCPAAAAAYSVCTGAPFEVKCPSGDRCRQNAADCECTDDATPFKCGDGTCKADCAADAIPTRSLSPSPSTTTATPAASVTCTSRAGNAFVLPEGSVCPDVPTTTSCAANQHLCEVRDTSVLVGSQVISLGYDIVESYCETQGRPCRPYCQWPANTACLETQRDTLGNFVNQHYVCKNIQTDCPCGHTKCNVNGKEVCLAGSTCPTPVCSDTDLSCPATWPSTQGYCRPATSVCGCGVECAVAGTGTLKQCYPGTACPDTSACPGANEVRCPTADGGTACMVAPGGTCPAVAVPVVCPDSLKCSRPVINSAATGTTTTTTTATMTEEYCLPVGSTETVCPVTCSADQQSCPSRDASGVECRPASDTCPEVCPSGQQICSKQFAGITLCHGVVCNQHWDARYWANHYCSATCCPAATPYHCGTDTAGSPICSATLTCPVLCPSDHRTCLNSYGGETCMPSGTACPTFCPEGYTRCGRETTDAAGGATVVSQQCVKAEKEDGSTWPCPAVCPLDLPVLCDGDAVTAPSCAANAASCPSVVQCGGGFKLCQRALVPAAGTTATGTTTAQTIEKFCVEDLRPCPATCGTGLVSCSDGSCAPSTTLCPITCGVGQILCDTEVMRATIAGITQSNPAVVTLATAVAGVAVGDALQIEGVSSMWNVNGMSCTVTAITSTTSVTCGGLDSTAFSPYLPGFASAQGAGSVVTCMRDDGSKALYCHDGGVCPAATAHTVCVGAPFEFNCPNEDRCRRTVADCECSDDAMPYRCSDGTCKADCNEITVTCMSRAGNAFVLPEGSVCPDVATTTCGANQHLCEVRDTTGNDIVESYCETQGRLCRPYCRWPENTACLETHRDTLGNFMNQHYVCKNIQTDCPCGHTKCNVNGKEVCLAGSTCPTPVCSDTDLSCPATWPSTQGYCRPATSVCGCGVECAVASSYSATLKQCYPKNCPGSMSGGTPPRIDVAKEAAKGVINTLSWVDYATIVTFSSSPTVAKDASNQELIMPMTVENRQRLKDFLDGVQGFGRTDMDEGFKKAFDVLDNSRAVGKSTSCTTVILFVTDGQNTGGHLIPIIEARNKNSDLGPAPRIFT
eukprot:g262.t1